MSRDGKTRSTGTWLIGALLAMAALLIVGMVALAVLMLRGRYSIELEGIYFYQ
jgi:hypothetical protein